MALPPIPFAPGRVYDNAPGSYSIAQLMMRQGDIAARRAENSGQIWGNAVKDIGQIAGQAVQQHQEEKRQQRREAAVNQVMQGWDGQDPQTLFRGLAPILGPEASVKVATGMGSLMAAHQKQQPDQKDLAGIVGGVAALEKANPGYIERNWQTLRPALDPVMSKFGSPLQEQYSPEYTKYALTLDQQLNPSKPAGTRQVEVVNPDGTKTVRIVEDKPGQEFTSATERKAQPTQNINGRVMQYNPQSGRFDVDLGKSEAALNREAASGARADAAANKALEDQAKRAEKDKLRQEAKKANDEQVDSAFAALNTSLGEVKKYAGASALTSPLEAANARQQFKAAALAFAATLSRATGDNRISDSDRKAYGKLVAYLGPGSEMLMVARPDLVEKRLEEARKMFAAASDAKTVAPPPYTIEVVNP
jgi:hypothetical protein